MAAPVDLSPLGSLRRGRLWLAPSAGIAVAVVAAVVALLVDGALRGGGWLPVYVGTVATARTLLSVVATSLATLMALVLTIVAVVLQLASARYSHRALRTFLRDTQSHVFLFTAAGTFAYTLVALLGLDGVAADDGTFTGITVPLAFLAAVVSLAVFVRYIDHIVHASRGTAIIARIGDESRGQVERLFPDDHDPDERPPGPPDGPAQHVVAAPRAAVIDEVDVAALVGWATEQDRVVVVMAGIGNYLPAGAPMLAVHAPGSAVPAGADPGGDHQVAREAPDGVQRLVNHVRLDAEPTITDDVWFGFRLLVDIAITAISPAVNDPTTAVQCLDQLHDLLRRLSGRRFPVAWHSDDAGTPRLFLPGATWDEFVRLAGSEIRLYGAGDVQVVRRLAAMWSDLHEVVPDARRGAVAEQLERVFAAGDRALGDNHAGWREDLPEGLEGSAPRARQV